MENVKEIAELMGKGRNKIKKRRSARRMIVCSGICFAVLLCSLSVWSMQVKAAEPKQYFGVDEDYLLRTKKPEERGKGHYFEYVNEETYTVQAGDTLWGIARKYYGSGTAYQKLWDDNKERVNTPETLQVGTELKIAERLYTGVGMQDYVYDEVMNRSMNVDSTAWEWEPDGECYQLFQTVTYRNDFGENDPYSHWEEFQREVTACSREICGGRVSDLFFARYRVTDLCDMCYYQFGFDGSDKEYLIMAAFAYTDERESEEFVVYNGYGDVMPMECKNMKCETFTVCDLDRCDKEDLQEAKGKTFYEAARCIDSLMYYPKMADYIGAEDWNYPQLHNPFTQAMRSFCDEPLERAAVSPDDQKIVWKDAVLEKLVREELAELWRLTEEEKMAFMARPMTTADISGIKSLSLYENREKEVVYLQLNGYEETRSAVLFDEEGSAESSQTVVTTLDDLANFTELNRLDIHLCESDIDDFSAVGRLTGLREFCLDLERMQNRIGNQDIAFLGELTNLRLLYLYGWDHNGGWMNIEPTQSLERITDLSVLENCPQLTYLKLATGNVENYDFLENLPQIYYIELMGADDMKNVSPDTTLLPNACFIEYYDEQILFDIGRE